MRRFYPGYCARSRGIDQNMLDKFGNLTEVITKITQDPTQAHELDILCAALEHEISNTE
jgi:hypothetical protein